MTANLNHVLNTLKVIRTRQRANDGGLFAQLQTASQTHGDGTLDDPAQPRWWWLGPLDAATRYGIAEANPST